MVFACILSWIPNINPNYPIFNFIFLMSGFYLLPPFLGFTVAPVIVMMGLVLLSIGLQKIYFKFFGIDPSKVIVLTKDEFEKQLDNFNRIMNEQIEQIDINEEQNKKFDNTIEKEDNNDDCR